MTVPVLVLGKSPTLGWADWVINWHSQKFWPKTGLGFSPTLTSADNGGGFGTTNTNRQVSIINNVDVEKRWLPQSNFDEPMGQLGSG